MEIKLDQESRNYIMLRSVQSNLELIRIELEQISNIIAEFKD